MNNIVNLTKCYIETIITMKNQVILILGSALILGIFQEGFIVYGAGAAIISAIIIVSINIPVFLKYGALNGRVVLTLVNMAGLFLPILIVEKISTMNVLSIFTSNDNILVLFIILVAMLIIYISYCISLNLYNKKEVKK